MLSQAQRTAILELNAKGVSRREIARVLQVSRLTVRKVVRANSPSVPAIQRAEKAEPYRQQILDLLASCKGNLVRVHEELTASGAVLSYPALTGFCRRQGIGQTPIVAAGQYHFEPGVEMQHDTSPHEVEVGGKKYKAQTASAVLCYSHMLFFQVDGPPPEGGGFGNGLKALFRPKAGRMLPAPSGLQEVDGLNRLL